MVRVLEVVIDIWASDIVARGDGFGMYVWYGCDDMEAM